MNKTASHEVAIPVRARVTFSDDDGGHAAHFVHCLRRGQSVPYGMCLACPEAVALPAHAAAGGAEVRCLVEGPVPARQADFGESAVRVTVGEIMRRRVACVRPQTSWETLEGLLLDDDAGAVPVVDAEDLALGIVTKTDLLRWR